MMSIQAHTGMRASRLVIDLAGRHTHVATFLNVGASNLPCGPSAPRGHLDRQDLEDAMKLAYIRWHQLAEEEAD